MEKKHGSERRKVNESLINLLERARKDMRANLPFIREEIEEIITSKNRNGARIEQNLDTLMDYMEMGVGEREFVMLNRYYEGVDKKGYEFYKKEYEKRYK